MDRMSSVPLYPVHESDVVNHQQPLDGHTSPVEQTKCSRMIHPLRSISSESDILETRELSVERYKGEPPSSTVNSKMPSTRRFSSVAMARGNSASQLQSPQRRVSTGLPTVGSVVEKFNFGLKEQLKKSELQKKELEFKQSELLQSLSVISTKCDEAQSLNLTLVDDKAALETKYRKLKSHAGVMKADYDRVNGKLSSLEVANESLKQTSWIQQSRRGKKTSSDLSAGAVSEVLVLKDSLLRKEVQVEELKEELHLLKDKLHSKSPVTAAALNDCSETATDGSKAKYVFDDVTLNAMDHSTLVAHCKRLMSACRVQGGGGADDLSLDVARLQSDLESTAVEKKLLETEANELKLQLSSVKQSGASEICSLQTSLQLASSEKEDIAEDNKRLKAALGDREAAVKSLEVQLQELQNSAPKREEVDKLKATVQSVKKERSILQDNEKSLNNKISSLKVQNTQLAAQLDQVNAKVNRMKEMEVQQRRDVERHHKAVQTMTEHPIERTRPASESKSSSTVKFYRTSSQNSESDLQTDKVSEAQALEMKIPSRLNIRSSSTTRASATSPTHGAHPKQKAMHTKSLSGDASTKSVSPVFDDTDSVGSSDSFTLSSSSPASMLKASVTSVKVSSIKLETPTKINAMGSVQRRHSPQPQMMSSSSTHHNSNSPVTGSSQSRVIANHTATSHAVSFGPPASSGATHQPSASGTHAVTTAPHTATASLSSTVASSSSSSSSSSSGAHHNAVVTPPKPRPLYKSNTSMAFVTTTKSPSSTFQSPLLARPQSISSPPKPSPDTQLLTPPTDAPKSPSVQKSSTVTISTSGTGVDVVRRRSNNQRVQRILDPTKRSSAYFPNDVVNLTIEENDLHRAGSLESLKSALFTAVSTKAHPTTVAPSSSTNSSNTSTSGRSTVNTAPSSTGFSAPIAKLVTFNSSTSGDTTKSEAMKQAEMMKKGVKFAADSQQHQFGVGSSRARPRETRHQSINTPLPSVSSYYSPQTPTSKPAGNNAPPGKVLKRSNTIGVAGGGRPSKKTLLLRWCQRATEEYDNVNIRNFSDSFSDGLAFCAIIHHFAPSKVPYQSLSTKNRERNFELAFKAAEEEGIPSLLDVSDMVSLPVPDWMSVMTYVGCIHQHYRV